MIKKTLDKTVTCCKDCPFYDDGYGNGSCVSGCSVEPPYCTHPYIKGYPIIYEDNIVPKWCPLRKGAYHKEVITIIKLKSPSR